MSDILSFMTFTGIKLREISAGLLITPASSFGLCTFKISLKYFCSVEIYPTLSDSEVYRKLVFSNIPAFYRLS